MFLVLEDLLQDGLLHVLITIEDVVIHQLDQFLVLRLVHQDSRQQHHVVIGNQVQRPLKAFLLARLRNGAELTDERVDLLHLHRALHGLAPGVGQVVELIHETFFFIDRLRRFHGFVCV